MVNTALCLASWVPVTVAPASPGAHTLVALVVSARVLALCGLS